MDYIYFNLDYYTNKYSDQLVEHFKNINKKYSSSEIKNHYIIYGKKYGYFPNKFLEDIFDWEYYLSYNKIILYNKNEALTHFINEGCYKNYIFSEINLLSKNINNELIRFDYKYYNETYSNILNEYQFINNNQLLLHWYNIGFLVGLYPNKYLAENFNHNFYKTYYTDTSKLYNEQCLMHYYTIGIYQNRAINIKNIKHFKNKKLDIENIEINLNNSIFLNKKKRVFIIQKRKCGGSYKVITDIIKNFNENEYYFIENKESLLNISFKKTDIIIIQYLLSTDIDILDIINLKYKYNFKIIILIHDFYWLNNPLPLNYSNNFHNVYRNFFEINIDHNVIKLFDISDIILFPSIFSYNIYNKLIKDKNFICSQWSDKKINYDIINIPKIINNEINIGILHEFSEAKGKENYEYMISNIKIYKEYTINYKIIDINIPKYNENEFTEFIKKYNINILTFLNKWGETYCYTLTKALNSGLPIFYNNIGSFKERVIKKENHFLNIQNENEYYNFDKLENNFKKILEYVINNENKQNNLNDNSSFELNKLFKIIF